ncbi:MAG: shikimate kinase [Planctomycetes bacterium]|nr:shikimate kinase [Planctomycetota bacterium]
MHQLIYLIGYRGTGKSTLAKLLAERLGWTWLDADAVLEARHGKSIRAIFAGEGEASFRASESAILRELSQSKQQVIATGGGVILSADNRALLKTTGWTVWLTASAQELWRRLQADAGTVEHRPALAQGGLAEIEELLQARQPHYQACADLQVGTEDRSPEAVADLILSHWEMAKG